MENTKFEVFIDEKSQDYGRFFLEPLERGYGDTLGNALRRLLLSSIRGAAVTAVKIEGVLHEFSTIKGIREDVIEILANFKHIPIKAKTEKSAVNEDGFKIITLDSDDLPKDFFTREVNPGVITAKDMPWDNDFEFCGDGVLCTLEPGSHLLMEIYVEQGVGYLSAERERPSQPPLPIDAMLADAIFSPVKRVNYTIKPARVGQSIDYEQLILEVWTNGAVTPEEAVVEAATIAQNYFGQIASTVNTAPQKPKPDEVPEQPVQGEPEPDDEDIEQLSHPIHELELSIRSENCLLRGGIQTVGELLQRTRDDLLKIRNLGKKSLTEIEDRLLVLGYALSKPQPASAKTKAAKTEGAEPETKPEESDTKPEQEV
ncbi:MAG: DNA-directed RNA polymerase subunit alpha [Synergistaceae bacterium]|nr:DNA-directed RNA polymerase subunit alpha [Synergistaceae bacterium]